MHQIKAYEICANTGHLTDICSTLQEDYYEHANVAGGFPGWRDYPNLSYRARLPKVQPRPPAPPPHSPSKSGMSLEEIIKSLAINTQQFRQETGVSIQEMRESIQNLKKQVSQLATLLSRLESQWKLLLQTIINPKQNVCAITLRNDKELKEPIVVVYRSTLKEETKKEVVASHHWTNQLQKPINKVPKSLVIKPPFPERSAKSNKEEEEKKIFETFPKVKVNIPLLDIIKRIHRFAKFLKELCTNKKKLKDFYMLNMVEDNSPDLTQILLRRPFLRISRTNIDVYDGTLTIQIC
ncbi:hypothetical protein CDL12_28966 [Handroanthus impetiginosus]|uniref:Uncharacterized protein n=1 Tax=Handroanthus impetiginosus TaxID=429701 RepID=A0A2G9G038_9LAMI|nr:hypothetical protein CDL12_28966 [Handroanthus impetiginosus]